VLHPGSVAAEGKRRSRQDGVQRRLRVRGTA
jgi:hypothetical protein